MNRQASYLHIIDVNTGRVTNTTQPQQSRDGNNGAAASSSSSSSAREHVSAASPANTGRVTNTTQPQQSQARQQQSWDGNNGAAASSSSSSSAREHVSAASPANTGRVTNTTQPQQSQARQMVQLTLTNVDNSQKNKRNLDTMTLSAMRGDKEDRYEHDDEGSLYAESTLEMPRKLHPNVPTTTTHRQQDKEDHSEKKTTVAKPRKKRSETCRLESPWGYPPSPSRCWKTIIRPLRYYWADPPPAGYILCWSSSQPRKVTN
jgi:hypothetical protein